MNTKRTKVFFTAVPAGGRLLAFGNSSQNTEGAEFLENVMPNLIGHPERMDSGFPFARE